MGSSAVSFGGWGGTRTYSLPLDVPGSGTSASRAATALHRASATGTLRQRAPEASSLQDTETSGDKLLEVTGCCRVDSSRVPAARDSDVLVAALDRRPRAYRLATGAEGQNAHAGAAGQVMECRDFAA